MTEKVILVNEYDQEVGTMEKLKAHQLGLCHRAFSVVLLNNHNEILLQQRAHSKYHSPGLWSNTCCSHPRPGEDTLAAAQRRLQEEMGIQCTLSETFSFTYKARLDNDLTEHEFDHVYLGYFSGTPNINSNEVADWKYMSLPDIRVDLVAQPDKYSYWFKILVEKLQKEHIAGLTSA